MVPAWGMISKECELLDELVVEIHHKEAINGFTTLEVKFKLDIIKAGRFDKPVGGELHMDTSTFGGVGWVTLLEFEAKVQGFHIKFLVPACGALLHPHAHGSSQRFRVYHNICRRPR